MVVQALTILLLISRSPASPEPPAAVAPPALPAAPTQDVELPAVPQTERIPHPLRAKGQGDTALPAPPRQDVVVDLRDPFLVSRLSDQGKSKRGPSVAYGDLLLPDLKDPFAFNRRIQPRAWVQLPGDIRNPFSPSLERKRKRDNHGGCLPPEQISMEGVVIQKPHKATQESRSPQNCKPAVPLDLRDPFKV